MRHFCFHLISTVLLIFSLALFAFAQAPAAPAPATAPAAAKQAAAPQSESTEAEITRHEGNPAVFKVKVTLVTVPVVVRDRNGHAIGGLKASDFQIYDHGKLQVIKHFEQETPLSRQQKAQETVAAVEKDNAAMQVEKPSVVVSVPTRFIAYLFDDLHLKFEELAQVRTYVEKHINKDLTPGDRVALYTTSGQNLQEFTDDHEKLLTVLKEIGPKVGNEVASAECPPLSYYLAWKIDEAGFQGPEYDYAMAAVKVCTPRQYQGTLGPSNVGAVTDDPNSHNDTFMVRSTVGEVISRGDVSNHRTLDLIHQVVRRMSAVPGERLVVLISPGFIAREERDISPIIEDATHNHIIVNTLDARGLFLSPGVGDASISTADGYSPDLLRLAAQYRTQELFQQNGLLADISVGTGGTFAHDNDFEGSLQRTAVAPEYSYFLAFSPQNLKHDGAFHKIRVVVNGQRSEFVQARRGYLAPLPDGNPDQQAQAAVREALFSQDELKEIPVTMQLQYYKTDTYKAKVSVLLNINVASLPMRKENGRNNDTLSVYAAVFDNNGNYISGRGQTIEMKLRDVTLNEKLKTGVGDKISFDVQSGNYLLRAVVRDSEGELVSAISRTVHIQ